ncbi:MAG TPA: helix-turn-helix transcriptional regulator, partial [Acidobacteriaceae bacterium]|nr:helix-turn-helix transcriptional regulator [Acidobacteriaceae bacterium]
AVFQFSTDDVLPHERAAAVREMHERCALPVQPEPMEPLSGRPAHINITQWALPGLGIMSGVLSGLRQQIMPQHLAPTGANDAFFAFDLAGSSIVVRKGEEVVMRHGDAFLAIRGAKGFSVARPKSVRFIGLRFPSTVLSRLVPDFDSSDVHVFQRGAFAPKLLRRYLSLIMQESALATSELQRAAVTHIYDLAAVALGATAERAELARNRGIRAARLETVKAEVLSRLDDGNLSVALVAGRHGVTQRYLQKLFEAEGTSFSEFVLAQRLEKAHSMLTNPLYAHRAISSVAYDVGFNDLSYFNRAFRRRYGSTPSEVRSGQ